MKCIILLLLAIINSQYICAQSKQYNVRIKVYSDLTDSTSKVFITGNHSELGSWSPDRVELTQFELYWQKDFMFDEGTTLEFKFTKGDWDSEALDKNGNTPGNHKYKVTRDTLLCFNIENWKDGNNKINLKPDVTGIVKFHRDITYKTLLPRDIIVWLPPGYEENKSTLYPVLYMHDGQNIFDPQTSFGGIDWQMDEAADSLIRKKEITPIIIVGIYNTLQRTMEYTPGHLNDIYTEFVTDYLKPIIDSTYRTYPDRYNTYVGGSSYGGTISFILLWEHSQIFSKAACFSPGFITSEMNYVDKVNKSDIHDDVELYLDNGGIGLEGEIQIGIDSMLTVLQNKGFKAGEDYYFILDEKAEHSESAWAKRVPTMMKILFGK